MASPNRYYSSTAQPTALVQNLDDIAATMKVAAVSGFPVTCPYTLVVDEGTVGQEVVTVTGASGTTLTVTRGVDGTSAAAHVTGSVVTHSVSARDYAEPQAFIAEQGGSWTAWTPVFSSGSPTFTSTDCAYKKVQKSLWLRFSGTILSIGSGTYQLTLPGGLATPSTAQTFAAWRIASSSPGVTPYMGQIVGGGFNGVKFYKANGIAVASTDVGAGDTITFTTVLEVA